MEQASTSADAPDGSFDHVRSEPRDSMFLIATLRRPGGPDFTAKVRNLSGGGMMAEVPISLSRGEPIETELRGIGRVGGHVAWTAGTRIGVAFDRHIDPRLARRPLTSAPQQSLVKVSRQTWRPGLR